MWRQICLAIGAALVLALGASTTFAVSTSEGYGFASFGTGGAYVQRLASGQTRVQMRLTGMTPGMQPAWQLLTGSTCGVTTGTVLIGPSTAATVSSIGTSLTSATFPVVVPSGAAPTFVTVRLYASLGPNGALGPEIGCGQVIGVPDLGTQHWW
jgi:hypothetical protein